MRIAFTSCMLLQRFPRQDVWDWIREADIEHLVLLGDSIYMDIDASQGPRKMTDNEFALAMHGRYREQLAQPQFHALLRQLGPGHVHAIWDDHDFLWNNACGAAVAADPAQRSKLPLTNAFFNAFRRALAAPGSFPSRYNDAVFWNPQEPSPGPTSLSLAPDIMLHLSDGRSWRTEGFPVPQAKRQLLGEAQRARLKQEIQARPQALHLLASGSTSSTWKRYPNDWNWLLGLAADQRLLMLSGDVHHNDVDRFDTAGLPLHEATSSGAAVLDAVVLGDPRENFGLLEINSHTVELRLYAQRVEQAQYRRSIQRASWQQV